MTAARDICDLLQARSSSGRQAFEIVDAVFAKIIAILRRRFGIGQFEAELLLVDVVREREGTASSTHCAIASASTMLRTRCGAA